jgi:Papain family cysteine protease
MSDLVVINDSNWQQHAAGHEPHPTGLIPRDYRACPVGYLGALARPFDLPLIPRPEWRERLSLQQATKSQLSDLRERGMFGQRIPARDQDGKGYCWAHSSVSACLLMRAAQNQPYADLSAFAVACIIKNYRDEGGWGSQSLEWIAKNGVPTSKTWPQQSMSPANDTPEMRAEAALHKVTEWMDGDPRSIDQLVTCLLLNIPVVSDFNWWGHSVCSMDLVDVDPKRLPGSLRTLILNSWGDSWSQNGAGVLEGNKAIPDGMIMPRVIQASQATVA